LQLSEFFIKFSNLSINLSLLNVGGIKSILSPLDSSFLWLDCYDDFVVFGNVDDPEAQVTSGR